ncbi:hypothetical protein TRVA0_007S00760 [Trichomonascus vanleenenianus]|uniref:dTDP-glucose 4,6-dehydratase n=1 Tax=Trichomonascus vanleenenianus TaxID=2268995 RepID=UPI003ECB855C
MSPSKEPILIGPSRFPASPDIKNVLVTGGAGFIASWVVRHLTVQYPEYNVYCYDKLGYCSSIKNVSCLYAYPNFTFIQGDIIDEKHLTAVFEQYKIDTVLHLAAESHVDHSFGNPYQFTYTNVLGTQVVLEVSKRMKVRRVVHMSTDEVYGEVGKGEQDLLESSILVPTNPYAASKASSDMLVSAYLYSFKLPCVVVRCNNIYGPHQFPEKIIPKFISLLSSGRKCALHGDGQHTRRYLYVADAVAAIDTVLHKGLIGCIYNAGVDNEMSNLEVCKKLIALFNGDPSDPEVIKKHVEFTDDRPFNDSRYAIDSRRIHKLGWRPLTDFNEGLKTTVEWYLEHGQGWWGDVDQFLQPHPATKFEQPNFII